HLVAGTGENPRGKYAVHFHHAHLDPTGPDMKIDMPFVVEGSVVNGSPGWGFVNHDSYVVFKNNIGYSVVGAAFVTEAGSEIGAFVGNFALHSIGGRTNARFQFGNHGNGFWFQGSSVDQVENNIAARCNDTGYTIFNRPITNPATNRPFELRTS